MDRFKSARIQTDEHLLRVMRYMDLNPVRAGKIKHPSEYKWTSYHYYAYGNHDPLITPAPTYLELGNTNKARQEAYRDIVEELLKDAYEKVDYSIVHFIGDPEWAIKRQSQLQDWFRRRYLEWKESVPKDYWVQDEYP